MGIEKSLKNYICHSQICARLKYSIKIEYFSSVKVNILIPFSSGHGTYNLQEQCEELCKTNKTI